MCYTHFHSNKGFRGDLIAVLAVITIVAAAFLIYTADYYHSDSSAADALVSNSRVTVEQPDGNLVFIPASEPG
ncbi:alpha/beta hydrolase fold [Eubacterium sp. CAG:115]|nr:alpha/beta hydrolase fold [Eubacterium sp. CAG:115]